MTRRTRRTSSDKATKRRAKRAENKETKQSRTKPGVEIDREFDTTQLKLAQFKYQPHKDYLGHIFRWGFASKFVNRQTSVLDVGCGQEMPFARSLGGANPNSVPTRYLGVDLNKIKTPVTRKNFEVLDEFNFVNNWRRIKRKHELFDLIVNFEVFEHMTMEHGRKMLKGFKGLLAPQGKLVFSTPVFCSTYGMAKNHINEVTKAEMEKELERAGFKIIKQFGTFSNWNDLKKVATKDEVELYQTLGEFYGNEVLGCYLSPKYPEAARNVTHVCVHVENDEYEACEKVDSVVKS